jgi:hypothetical protein
MAAILISVGVITCENLACNKGGVHIWGMQHRYRNDSTRFRKACIFTTQKTLRENTCFWGLLDSCLAADVKTLFKDW